MLNQFLLLDELDARQRVAGQVDRLIEAVLAAVRDVHDFDDFRL
jgi:hypothetical protein